MINTKEKDYNNKDNVAQQQIAKKEFYNFLMGSLISILSLNFFIFNLGWYLSEIGEKKLSFSLSWALFFLPGIFILIKLKALLPKYNVYSILKWAEILKILTFLLCLLFIYYQPSSFFMYSISVLIGISYVPFYPATYIVLKNLSIKDRTNNFSSLVEISYQISGALALLTSGILYKYIGFLGLNIIAFFSSFLSFYFFYRNETNTAHILNVKTRLNLFEKFLSSPISDKTSHEFSLNTQTNKKLTINFKTKIFGYIHLIPQMTILISNIPFFHFVQDIMNGGPRTFGTIDSMYSVVALVTSLSITKLQLKMDQPKSLLFLSISLLFLYFFQAYFHPQNFGFLPYILFPLAAISKTALKISTRSVLIKTHTPEQLAAHTGSYQMFANIYLVFGSLIIGQIISQASVEIAFVVLGLIFTFFGLLSFYILPKSKIEDIDATN